MQYLDRTLMSKVFNPIVHVGSLKHSSLAAKAMQNSLLLKVNFRITLAAFFHYRPDWMIYFVPLLHSFIDFSYFYNTSLHQVIVVVVVFIIK